MNVTSEAKEKICISVDAHQLRALDRIAAELDRPRSWVFSKAVQQFLAPHGGEQESGAAVGAQDVAGHLSPRNAAPGPSFPGAAPFSETVNRQMANYSPTPEATPHVRATLDLHSATLARAGEHARQVAADAKSAREATARRTEAYLKTGGGS